MTKAVAVRRDFDAGRAFVAEPPHLPPWGRSQAVDELQDGWWRLRAPPGEAGFRHRVHKARGTSITTSWAPAGEAAAGRQGGRQTMWLALFGQT